MFLSLLSDLQRNGIKQNKNKNPGPPTLPVSFLACPGCQPILWLDLLEVSYLVKTFGFSPLCSHPVLAQGGKTNEREDLLITIISDLTGQNGLNLSSILWYDSDLFCSSCLSYLWLEMTFVVKGGQRNELNLFVSFSVRPFFSSHICSN